MARSRFLFILGLIVLLVGSAVALRSPGLSATTVIVSMLKSTLAVATPITLGMLAGLYCERSGVVNIAIEGMMLTAAFVGFTAAAYAGSLWVGLLAAVASGALLALLHSALSVSLKVDQIISGTVLNILATGLTGYFNDVLVRRGGDYLPSAGVTPSIEALSKMPVLNVFFSALRSLNDLPLLGPFFTHVGSVLSQKPIAWSAILLVVISHYLLFSTSWGLRIRAVGENPRAADTVGIRVGRVRYASVLVGGMIAGLGGAYFTLESTSQFEPFMTGGRGFIALAALIFGAWTPYGGWAAALLFGAASAFQSNAQQFGVPINSHLIGTLPYLLTIVVVAGVVGRARPPAAVGQPYETE